MNIFVTGELRAGKSTALRKALNHLQAEGVKIGGIQTYRALTGRGIYFTGYTAACSYEPEQQIGLWDGAKMQPVLPAFERMAELLLAESQNCGLLVIDELGFMEARSEIFRAAVFQLAASELPLTGVMRLGDIPWQRPLREHPDTELLTLTLENRDAMPELIYQRLRALLAG